MESRLKLIKLNYELIFMILVGLNLYLSFLNGLYMVIVVTGALICWVLFIKRDLEFKLFLSICIVGISLQAIRDYNMTDLLPVFKLFQKTISITSLFAVLILIIFMVKMRAINELSKIYNRSLLVLLLSSIAIFIIPGINKWVSALNFSFFFYVLQYLIILTGLVYYHGIYIDKEKMIAK